ncbi:hypothetical protein A176_003481 [Myxococcus hansupus]|uniref:Uncharacterized protein n=1 Tax=Pseudomyxococcus hansupus TaxID=1297742 RepID=A0A0H4WUU7_9BACT|nr:hypothetical protein A176_003481 [Myxococcus hansupus]
MSPVPGVPGREGRRWCAQPSQLQGVWVCHSPCLRDTECINPHEAEAACRAVCQPRVDKGRPGSASSLETGGPDGMIVRHPPGRGWLGVERLVRSLPWRIASGLPMNGSSSSPRRRRRSVRGPWKVWGTPWARRMRRCASGRPNPSWMPWANPARRWEPFSRCCSPPGGHRRCASRTRRCGR